MSGVQEYVVGFMFNSGLSSVVLVEKNRPQWQAGKLNGVGGHVESGETPGQAMAREFKEETGVTATEWTKFCEQRGPDFVVHYFYCVSDIGHDLAKTCTDEAVGQYIISFIRTESMVHHIPWLLQAAISNYRLPDYTTQFPDEHVDRRTDSYVVLDQLVASMSRSQPPPVDSDAMPVWDLVIEDMRDRDRVGRERYGIPLRAFNGRDALVDAYQEALDLAVYLRQAIEERSPSTAAKVLNKMLPGLK